MSTLLLVLVSYLMGSVPTGAIAGRLRGVDLRREGSGNLGFTNALRVLGWRAAVPVLIVDMVKGAVPVLFLAPALAPDSPLGPDGAALAAGIAAIAGHVWSVFVRFKGGRGIATTCGVFAALAPLPTAVGAVVWLVLVLTTRYVSVGSVVAAVVLPIAIAVDQRAAGLRGPSALLVTSILVAALVVLKHRANLRRLASGTENRFGRRRARED